MNAEQLLSWIRLALHNARLGPTQPRTTIIFADAGHFNNHVEVQK